MGRDVCLLVALALAAPVAGVSAQRAPDFTGVWTLATGAGGGPGGGGAGAGGRGQERGDAGSGWGPRFTIVQRADTLIVERNPYVPGDLQPALEFRYQLDGSRHTNTLLVGRGTQRQLSWASLSGGRLTITTEHEADDEGGTPGARVSQTLWLEFSALPARAPALIIETTRSGVAGGVTTTTRAAYRRG